MFSPPVSCRAANCAAIGVAVVRLRLCDGSSLVGEVAKINLALDAQLLGMLLGVDLVMETRVKGLVTVYVVKMVHNDILST